MDAICLGYLMMSTPSEEPTLMDNDFGSASDSTLPFTGVNVHPPAI